MLLVPWEKLQIDSEKKLKLLFITIALDASEDYLVSDKLYALIGEEMLKRFKEVWNVWTLKEVVRKLIAPKGINCTGNVEESKLLDCENEEIPI